MPNQNFQGRDALAQVQLGIRVDRPTATLPQGTAGSIFTITGGRVLMTAILGEVTTAIGGANAMKLIANPTVATAGDTDLCAAADLDTCDIGDLISITGTPGDGILVAHKGSVQMMGPTGVALQTGTLQLHCAGSTAGAIKWSIWYVPLDTGAYVTAAA